MTSPDKHCILLVSVGPPANADREFAEIRRRFERTRFREQFELVIACCVSLHELGMLLVRHDPILLHVSGHCTGDAELVFSNDDEQHRSVARSQLSNIIAQVPKVRYVVLNACHTDALASGLALDVDVAIGMDGPVDSVQAGEFASVFYTTLGEGGSLGHAFKMAGAITDCEQARLHTHAQVDPHLLYLARLPRRVSETAATNMLETRLERCKILRDELQVEFRATEGKIQVFERGLGAGNVALGLALLYAVMTGLGDNLVVGLVLLFMTVFVARGSSYGARLVAKRTKLNDAYEHTTRLAGELEQLLAKHEPLEDRQLERVLVHLDALAGAPLLLGTKARTVHLGVDLGANTLDQEQMP